LYFMGAYNDIASEIRYSLNKGKPYGNDRWVSKMGHTARGPGQPRGG